MDPRRATKMSIRSLMLITATIAAIGAVPVLKAGAEGSSPTGGR